MTTSTKKILQVVSFSGLAISIAMPLLVFSGAIEKQTYLNLMIVGMLLWFGTAIFWIKKDEGGM